MNFIAWSDTASLIVLILMMLAVVVSFHYYNMSIAGLIRYVHFFNGKGIWFSYRDIKRDANKFCLKGSTLYNFHRFGFIEVVDMVNGKTVHPDDLTRETIKDLRYKYRLRKSFDINDYDNGLSRVKRGA